MVAGKDDQGIVHAARLLQVFEEAAQVVIDLFDQAHIGGHHRLHHLVAGKGLAFHMVHIGGVDRMRVFQLDGGLVDWQALVGAVHVVIGRRHDIGPMGLDVGQVQAPGVVTGIFHKLDGPVGHIGRFGMLLLDAGRSLRIAHIPAAEEFTVVPFGGIGVFVPGVVAVIALVAQVFVIGQVRGDDLIRVQPVVAFVRFETALGIQYAEAGIGIDPQAFHALHIGRHMGLADQNRAQAFGA